MSKKILSIALAVVMLFSVLACTVGAANTSVDTTFPGTGAIGFRVVSDAYVGQPAGEEVTVKVFWVHPVGTDYENWLASVGNVVLAYNSGAYTYNTENDGSTSLGYDGRTWGAAYEAYLKPAANVNTGATITDTIIGKLTEAEAAYEWDKIVLTQMTVDSSVTTNAKGFPLDPDCEVFSLSFTTVRKITADDVIGIPSATINSQTKASYSTGSKQVQYATNVVNSEWAVPATVTVNDTATAKMRPGAADGTVDLGLTGTVNALSFEAGKEFVAGAYVAPNLNAVGVQARVNGVVDAAESTCIYETADGFKYRAAIEGMTADALASDMTIEVRTYITDVNGNTYFSNWMFIDATTVHDNAVGNGMAGIA